MRNHVIVSILFILSLSCSKDDSNDFQRGNYTATIVGNGDICSYFVVNLSNDSKSEGIPSGVYFAPQLHNKINGDNPFTGNGYEGVRLKLNCSLDNSRTSECDFMGRAIPYILVTSAEVDENQEDDIDQRMINNSSECLPFRKVYGTKQFDFDENDSVDIEFKFLNWRTFSADSVWSYSDLSISSYSNLIYFDDENWFNSIKGDSIDFNGAIDSNWDKFRAGKYLLRYYHQDRLWDDSYLQFGVPGYLRLLIKKDGKYHSAWLKFRVDLDTSCKCSTTIEDYYINPIANQSCIVGIK